MEIPDEAPPMAVVDNVRDSYSDIVDFVLHRGDVVEARNYTTYELVNFSVTSKDPTVNRIWDADDPRTELLKSEIRTVRQGEEPEVDFSGDDIDERLDLDDGTFYEDIIRTRISEDWEEWVELLSEDTETRKACSLFGSGPNPPCTSRLQWLIRDGELNCYTFNRSQDMMFAYPMDVGLFEHYQVQLANELGVDVGIHQHTMTSAHIYVEQLEEAKELALGEDQQKLSEL